MNRTIIFAFRGIIVAAFMAGMCGCAPYFATRVPFKATMEQTTEAIRKTAFNMPDLTLVADRGQTASVAAVGAGVPEERYIGLRSVASVSHGVRSAPALGIRVTPEYGATVVRLNSSGDDREAEVFAVALEQQLANDSVIPKDSLPLPIFPMQAKSSWLQQALNLLNPGAGLWYALDGNPYYSKEWWKPVIVGAADIGALALAIPAALHVIQGNAGRSLQYKFVVGTATAAALRYAYGMDGLEMTLEYNELVETPYNLSASYVRSRITSIGVSVQLP